MMRMEERERERDGDKMREKVVVTMGEVIMKKRYDKRHNIYTTFT